MNDINISTGKAILTGKQGEKLLFALRGAITPIGKNGIFEISILENTILIETEDVQTIVKLERQ